MDNRRLLDQLFERQEIDLRRGPLFDVAPGDPLHPPPMPAVDGERIEGMLIGVAIGDALGATTEFMRPGERAAAYGEIRDYLPNRHAEGAPIGIPSDDTQLTFRALEQLLRSHGRYVPAKVARNLARGPVFGLGRTVRHFLIASEAGETVPWHRWAKKSAGNGALMRISPIVLPTLAEGGTDLWVDAALLAMTTHNDSAAIAAAMGFAGIYRELLSATEPPPPAWWPERFTAVARQVEIDPFYRSRRPELADFQGPLWRLVEEEVLPAYERGDGIVEAGARFGSGAYVLETVPTALLILMRHGHDPEEAIVRAVNDTVDNDTIAAIVGAAVGALHGLSALPERWQRDLSGRMAATDDGRIFALAEEARLRWGADSD
jgi:ADP-ribosylglycohydrolase